MNDRADQLFMEIGNRYGATDGVRLFRAPGRVNLIGEHTDYNDGFVFPVAIDRDIMMAARPRDDRTVNLFALDFGTSVSFDLDDIDHGKGESWGCYPKGVAEVLNQEGFRLTGFDGVFDGTVPLGAGLSSSAALEVATATVFTALSEAVLPGPRMAKICQRAENEYAGVLCGIMDQFISCVAEPDTALFLDCRSLSFENVPFEAPAHALVIANTNKPRGLVDSEYNKRRRECEEGVRFFSGKVNGVTALRDVTTEQFSEHRASLPEAVADRCKHVIDENDRVLDSVQALQAGNLSQLGQLMNASHDSLRDLFEVSCRELDVMVEIARSTPGVVGSRMTGGGFGGCTITLVEAGAVTSLETEVRERYPSRTGFEPDIYVCRPAGGAGEIP